MYRPQDMKQSYAERVRAARNPQEALLVIAEGLDSVVPQLEKLANPVVTTTADDPWFGWDGVAAAIPSAAALSSEVLIARAAVEDPGRASALRRAEELRDLRALLERTHDGQDRQALEARIRLLQDDGITVAPPDRGVEPSVEISGDTLTVDIPPATPERQAKRFQWAADVKLGSNFLNMDDQEAAVAFAKGGPIWLYENREAVMQMPWEWRRMFVEDIAEQSQALAHEVGRDILKDTGTGQDPDTAIKRLYGE